MKTVDLIDTANRMLAENNRSNWAVFVNNNFDKPICWKPSHRMLILNKDMMTNVTPVEFRNEMLKEIADILSFEMRGFHAREDRHWNIIARFYGVRLAKAKGKKPKPQEEIPDDVI